MIKEKIVQYCNSIGLDTIGFVKCRVFEELREFYLDRKEKGLENEFEENDIEKRINPNVYMEDGKTIISIAFPYYMGKEDVDNGFSVYTKGYDYHRVVKSYLDKICTYINELGGKAIHLVDSNSLPERYIGFLAGLGIIGKNNMIITKKYGSYVFLGEIITDLEICCRDAGTFEDIQKYDGCNECKVCIDNCPTKAIMTGRKNPNICSSYITQKKELSKIDYKLIKNRIFGCDICQNTCPYNKEISFSNLEEFKSLDFMNTADIKYYADLNNKEFKEKIYKTSCGWRGKNVIRRNAIIRLHNEGEDIEKYKGDSLMINNCIDEIKRINN